MLETAETDKLFLDSASEILHQLWTSKLAWDKQTGTLCLQQRCAASELASSSSACVGCILAYTNPCTRAFYYELTEIILAPGMH